jgi:uncharacterized SAM-binding protein YcdF (DUF218 family)
VTVTAEPVVALTSRRRSRRVRVIAVLVLLGLTLAAALAALAAGRVVLASRGDAPARSDVIVVLGAAQFWGRPSPVLEARLAHAQDLYGQGTAPRVVTVGGKQAGDKTTEGQVGKDWLVRSGVPSGSVTAVPTGGDTLSSLTAVAHLMAASGWTSATIVTDPAHEARSLEMARALGIDAHGSPTTSGDGSSLTVDYIARETGGLLFFWLVERRGVDAVVTG